MNRNTVLWTLVVFFGATVLFALIRSATKDMSGGVTLVLQLIAGVVVVGAITLYLRRRR